MSLLMESLIDTLICLRRLLIFYEGEWRNEVNLLHFLANEIEQIIKEGIGGHERHFSIETLIIEYNYPRECYEEEDDETLKVEPYTLTIYFKYNKIKNLDALVLDI